VPKIALFACCRVGGEAITHGRIGRLACPCSLDRWLAFCGLPSIQDEGREMGRKRVRMPHEIPHELRKQLIRTARVIATLQGLQRVYANPEGVGGDSLTNNQNYAERARRGDRTVCHDFVIAARDELQEIIDALRKMDADAK
jgi:hypothetical protein